MIHLSVVEWVVLGLVFAIGTWLLAAELLGRERLVSLRGKRDAQKVGLADELLYRRLIRPDVVKNANGAYLAMFEIQLPFNEELDEQGLSDSDAGFAKALSRFGSEMVLHLHDAHVTHAEYDVPESYPHPTLEWLDGTRKDWFLTPGRVFDDSFILSVTYMPPKGAQANVRASLTSGAARAVATEDGVISEFNGRCDDFVSFLSSYATVRRLAVRDGKFSEMLEHLAWTIGGRKRNVRVPIAGHALNGVLTEEMERKPLRIGDEHVRVVVVTMLPDATYPMYLERLRELRSEYSFVVRFMPDDGDRARKVMTAALYDWIAKTNEQTLYVDPHSEAMAASARQALGAVSQGLVRFGRASVFVVLRHADREKADLLARRCVAKLDEIGLASYVAGWTAEHDFLATLPGDGYHSLRKFPIHALNVAHLFSPHGDSQGRRYNGSRNLPAQTPAFMYGTTPDGAQVRMHVSDRAIPDVGHLMGIGGTGLGKSVLLGAFSASYMSRFPGAGFTGLDKGRSLYRLTRWLDGTFYDLLGDESPGFALFSDIEKPDQARVVLSILNEMVTLQGVRVDPEDQLALEDGIVYMQHMRPELRSLTAYWEGLQDRGGRLRAAIRNYTKLSPNLGNLLDCEHDSFKTSRFNTIEISRILDLGPKYLIPVERVLFWKSRTQVKALRAAMGAQDLHWLYQIDEAHALLGDDLGRAFIKAFLKEARKEKYFLQLWSNAAEDFTKSGILNDLNEACRTRVIFKNVEVERDPEIRKVYSEGLGLRARGLDRLPRLGPRHILFDQPKSGETWELDMALDKAWLAVVGRTDSRDNERVDEFRVRYGSRWREELLRYEGVEPALIERHARLMQQHAGAVRIAS